MDKYADDKFDREKYIPKGYILPDGTMLTKKYARYHQDMAERYIAENWANRFKNDIIKEPKDFMLARLDALQVLSCGKPIVIYAKGNNSKVIQDAVVSYLSYGWEELVLDNPYKSSNEYLRTRIINGGFAPYDKRLDDMTVSQLSSILLELENQYNLYIKIEDKENCKKQIEKIKLIIKEKQELQGLSFD